VGHIRAEKDTLEHVDHPCVIRLFGAFQDPECIYLVMVGHATDPSHLPDRCPGNGIRRQHASPFWLQEFVSGGEFFTHLKAVSK